MLSAEIPADGGEFVRRSHLDPRDKRRVFRRRDTLVDNIAKPVQIGGEQRRGIKP